MRVGRPALGLALAAAVVSAGSVLASTPAELFEQGNTDYEEGRFEDAAAAYRQILQYGLEDPRVHYNLGNALFKAGRLGSAILHYERTLRLDPTDREARQNLEFARGLILDRVAEPEIPYPLRIARDWLDRRSTGATAAVFLVVYLAAAGLAGALPLTRSTGRRRVLAYGAIAAGLVAALSGAALYYKTSQASSEHAIVLGERLDVRSGPAEDNTVLFTVHEGTRVEIRNRLGDWYQISLPNALSGWVPAADVEEV